MKKHLSLLAILLAVALHASAQLPPTWAWALPWSGKSYEKGTCIATDIAGNTYAAGIFTSDTLFNTTGVKLINSCGPTLYGYDLYIIKYTPSGSIIWTKTFGHGNYSDEINDITTDAAGNIYITGRSMSTTLTLGGFTLSNAGATVGLYNAKLNASGNVLWAKKVDLWPAAGVVIPSAITTDISGNTIATGHFTYPSIGFGTYTLTNTVSPYLDVYVVKYDPSGNVLWAKSFGAEAAERTFDVTTDKWGNICIVGIFNSTSLSFGTYTLTTTISSPERFFATKLDPAGNVLWAQTADGHVVFNGVSSDGSGNFIMAGMLNGTLSIGSTTLTATPGGDFSDVLLMKCDNAGSVIWARNTGGVNGDLASGVTTDTSGNIYITGQYRGPGTGPTFGDSILSNAGSSADLFVAKYNSAGTALWGVTAKGGNSNEDSPNGIAVDRSGSNIYITGYTGNDTLQLGALTMVAPRISATPHYNVFIAKVYQPLPPTVAAAHTLRNNVNIYPNPADDLLIIEGDDITEVIITDISGRKALHQKAQSQCTTIDVATLAPAIYTITVTTGNGVTTQKFLKR